jgi:predicted metal-dependent phosphoesterase TrpH
MTHRNAKYVDLHIHSTFSDGSLSPEQIVQAARKTHLKAISITDHDTLDGTIKALDCDVSGSLERISGIEMSVRFPCGSMHILGYLMHVDDQSLTQRLSIVQEARTQRNLKIVKKLQTLGVDIEYDDVLDIAGGGQVGRPHFAQTLVRKGSAENIDAAFDRFLKKGCPAYVSRYRLEPDEAIEAITNAGGVAVLAHPSTLAARDDGELETVLVGLKTAGLKGLEVYYPNHDAKQRALYERLALRHGLVMTGGTDFHGALKPHIRLGVGKGDLRVPYGLVESLKACRL